MSELPEPASEPLHVLQVISTTDVGGAEHHLLALCRGLVERGHRVDVAYLKGQGTLCSAFEELGIAPCAIEIERPLGYFRGLWNLWRLCRKQRYRIVHTHLLKANALGAVAARLAGIRAIVASKHNDEPQLRNPAIAWAHRLLGRLDRRVLHASRHIERYMVEVGGVDRRKSETVYYGVDAEASGAAPAGLRRELGIPSETVVVACVARLIRRKGHLVLLEAFREVVERLSEPVCLWIVGKGLMESSLRRRATELGLDGRVHFTGERQDVPAILREADVFTLASEAEGLGLVLLEAMAASLPVVATRAGGMPEIAIDGETGLLVAAEAPPELAAALRRLCCDESLRRRMGARGRQRAILEFSHERLLRDILRAYRAVI